MNPKRKHNAVPNPPRRRPEGGEEDPPPSAETSSTTGLTAADPSPDGGSEPAGSPISREPSLDWRGALRDKLRLLPRQSGVYLFRDARGRVIYVGKAKLLHLRVRSYFRGPAPDDPRLRTLRRRIRSLDWVATSHEVEALILEDTLIKRYAPRFNIRLKDDKRYPFLKVTVGSRFPALVLTREVHKDGSRYFGPFTRVRDLRRILKSLRPVFRLRNCTDRRLEQGGRECLQYFIGRCTAPCTQRVGQEEYAQQVEPLLDFLSGRGQEAITRLETRMKAAAGELRFEESARLRDDAATLRSLMEEQAVAPPVEADADVVGLVTRGNLACGVFLQVREGQVLGKSHHSLTGVRGAPLNEQMRALLLAAVLGTPRAPRALVLALAPADLPQVEAALAAHAGRPVEIVVSPRGGLAHLLTVAEQNAHLLLEEQELSAASKRERVDRSVYALQEALTLEAPPYRIEGFDISNTQGRQCVASQVVFQDGKPLKSAYRRYRMRGSEQPDDFAMMGEVLRRRLERLQSDGGRGPDLILVDGGKGQVGRAWETLSEMGLSHLPVVGLAKKQEEIFRPGQQEPIRLPRASAALRLLQRVRDESHRFAVGYHRGLRLKAQRVSRLDGIPGIGPSRRRLLLRQFGSLKGMLQAGAAAWAAVPGIGPKLAAVLEEALQRDPAGNEREEQGPRA